MGKTKRARTKKWEKMGKKGNAIKKNDELIEFHTKFQISR